ncbi:MAG: hypothetical protein ACI9N3_001235, partial [Colwellia sp.]
LPITHINADRKTLFNARYFSLRQPCDADNFARVLVFTIKKGTFNP